MFTKKEKVTSVPMQYITKLLAQTPPKMVTLELQNFIDRQSSGTNNLTTRFYTHHTERLEKEERKTVYIYN